MRVFMATVVVFGIILMAFKGKSGTGLLREKPKWSSYYFAAPKRTGRGYNPNFNWEDVRRLPAMERTFYMGSTVNARPKWMGEAYWYLNDTKLGTFRAPTTRNEFKRERLKDAKRMAIELGVEEKPETFSDDPSDESREDSRHRRRRRRHRRHESDRDKRVSRKHRHRSSRRLEKGSERHRERKRRKDKERIKNLPEARQSSQKEHLAVRESLIQNVGDSYGWGGYLSQKFDYAGTYQNVDATGMPAGEDVTGEDDKWKKISRTKEEASGRPAIF